jgi:Magnesium chelatase, subunit ChlI C-terminal
MSARAYQNALAVAATLAKLDGADKIGRVHVAEALSYLGTTHPPKPDQQANTKHLPRSPLQSSQP